MPNPPVFPHTQVVAVDDWNNFHGTIEHKKVQHHVRPIAQAQGRDRAYAESLSAILRRCFDDGAPVRTQGALWSLSNIIEPKDWVLDPSDLNALTFVPDAWAQGAYAAHLSSGGGRALIAQGGAHIFRINQELGEKGFAIRTSGAADGHRIAGLIATATHGSALKVGALHETVKALHLVIAPDKAVLLQASSAPFKKDLAQHLEHETGLATELVSDDELFHAAQVSLGSFGIVFSVILDVAPLYVFDGATTAHAPSDPAIKKMVETLDGSVVGHAKKSPYHLALVVSPYALPDEHGHFVTAVSARDAAGIPYTTPDRKKPLISSNLGDIVTDMVLPVADGPSTAGLVERFITQLAETSYGARPIEGLFAGTLFGPSRLPRGVGTSTELVLDHARAWEAIEIVSATLRREGKLGKHLYGALGVRFVPKSDALLAMNIHDMNCYVELPTMRPGKDQRPIPEIYLEVWKALDDAGIVHTDHWGQIHRFTPARVEKYYGDRASRWKKAREKLLDATARKVFASPILKDAGLD